MKACRFLAFACAAASLAVPGAAGVQPPAQAAEVAMSIKMAKNCFVQEEPAIVSITLHNKSNTTLRLAEPAITSHILRFVVQRLDKGAPPLVLVSGDTGWGADADWIVSVAPGACLVGYYDLLLLFRDGSLPPGSYSVTVTYQAPLSLEGAWRGCLTSAGVAFTVRAPTADEAGASASVRSAKRALHDTNEAMTRAAQELSLVATSAQSPFTTYSHVLLATLYGRMKDEDRRMAELQLCANDISREPFYGRDALYWLAVAQMWRGQWEPATKLTAMLPPGHLRAKLQKLQAALREKAAAPEALP